MKLSVVIVNYNVIHFLEQCLYSVEKALKGIEGEVLVVDNRSVDGSVEMVKEKFPRVRLIVNDKNLGFSKANNQAIEQCKGEYILLLNPDTIVEEQTFSKVLRFMDQHPDAGGLGVKMIDGKGNFLPESKRGLPTPSVAFSKIFGLSALFPKSKRFNRYHLGHLDKNKTHEIEILSGAFMLLRKSVLDQIGNLDEAFFMYGEDIDLSYRIIKAGYKNYYLPEAQIVHYKGESTKKSSINYVFVFYRAMIIFAKKHFTQQNAFVFSLCINLAIYFRAGIALLNRFFKKAILPIGDALLIGGGLLIAKEFYEPFAGVVFPKELLLWAFPAYILLWIVFIYLNGGYDRPIELLSLLKGILIGTAVILAAYALLPEDLRFSRALILIGAVGALTGTLLLRLVLHALFKSYKIGGSRNERYAIVGDSEEMDRVANLLSQTHLSAKLVQKYFPEKNFESEYQFEQEKFKEFVEVNQIEEVIFCAKDISSQAIIHLMADLDPSKIDYKIAPPESLYIIGSNSIKSTGDLFVMEINSINKPANQRKKRLVDFFVSLTLFIISPVLILFVKNKTGFLKNCFNVLIGKKSWVGYFPYTKNFSSGLPKIKTGVLHPVNEENKFLRADSPGKIESMAQEKLNVIYAKNYSVWNDVQIIFGNLSLCGNV